MWWEVRMPAEPYMLLGHLYGYHEYAGQYDRHVRLICMEHMPQSIPRFPRKVTVTMRTAGFKVGELCYLDPRDAHKRHPIDGQRPWIKRWDVLFLVDDPGCSLAMVRGFYPLKQFAVWRAG